jgi:hypothetical protein
LVALVVACGGGDDDGGGGDEVSVPDDYPYPVEQPDLLESRDHFPVGQVYESYTSNPPTSGPHASSPANWGVSDLAVPKEMAVPNMEHAGAVVWYDCNAGAEPLSTEECAELRNNLSSIVQPAVSGGQMVLMTPYPGMDSRIALTSWGVLDKFDEFDAARVRSFIDTFECHYDPEGFCG